MTASHEPIAILGLGCRYPGGAVSPDDLWRSLIAERDATAEFPTDRGWNLDALLGPDPDAPGATYVRAGSFIDNCGDFDAAFFGINPVSLHGSDTGVFIGAAPQEYGPRLYEDTDGFAGHLTTGTAICVASGRVAYTLGLHGPAVTVDTACSSSLVSLHLAVRSLRSGECDLALAGGVSVVCSPSIFIGFGQQHALAADGRCKPFAAAADGFGVAEGVGVLVLARLSLARARGHPVLALIRGS